MSTKPRYLITKMVTPVNKGAAYVIEASLYRRGFLGSRILLDRIQERMVVTRETADRLAEEMVQDLQEQAKRLD